MARAIRGWPGSAYGPEQYELADPYQATVALFSS